MTSPNLRAAIEVLESADKLRNLSRSIAIAMFVISAGLSLYGFFGLVGFFTWLGLDQLDPAAPGTLSFVLSMVFWVLIFLAGLMVLGMAGFGDLRARSKAGLSKLRLTEGDLHELAGIVTSRDWSHAKIFTELVAELISEHGPVE